MSSRIVLVTGANGGLGRAISRAFLDEPDVFVWMGGHHRQDEATALVGEFSGRCECLELDVTQAASWQQAVTCIVSRHHRLDALINNAGRHADYLLANMPVAEWQYVVETNL